MNAPDAVAVVRFGSVGDVILTTPAVEALRRAWPETRILYAVKERLSHLVAHDPCVDEVVPLAPGETPWSLARRLRGASVVLDLHGKIRSKLVRACMPRVPFVVWHKRDVGDTLAVKLAGRRALASMHVSDRFHLAVEELVGRELPHGRLRYHLGPGDREAAAAELRKIGIDPSRPILGISPGAAWATKRWPAERFGELAARALASGMQVVVQGSPAERQLAVEVCASAPGAAPLCDLDLAALGGLIAHCTAFVANDSGPMHMARALNVPTLALFGSTDPGMFDFGGHAVLFAGVPCSPCSFFGRARCPRGHFRCMLDLGPDDAWRALQPLLDGGRRLPVTA